MATVTIESIMQEVSVRGGTIPLGSTNTAHTTVPKAIAIGTLSGEEEIEGVLVLLAPTPPHAQLPL